MWLGLDLLCWAKEKKRKVYSTSYEKQNVTVDSSARSTGTHSVTVSDSNFTCLQLRRQVDDGEQEMSR